MQAVVETAEAGKQTFQNILSLRQEMDKKVVLLGRRAENASNLILHLYGEPAITVNEVAQVLGISYFSANQLVSALVEADILEEVTGWQRNRVFYFRRYMQIFNTKDNI